MKKQAGYSQIEVLVSVLVLAIGFLGMAGLQATSLQNSQKSVLRTQAAYLGYEILDRMRANPIAANAGSYNTDFGVASTTNKDCLAATPACTLDADMAAYDLKEWKCAVGVAAACSGLPANALVSADNALPNGDAKITKNITNGLYTVTIRWYEERNNAIPNSDAGYSSFTIESAL